MGRHKGIDDWNCCQRPAGAREQRLHRLGQPRLDARWPGHLQRRGPAGELAVEDQEGQRAEMVTVQVGHCHGINCARIQWVPNTVSPHATWEYSWIRPPSRSRRKTRILAPAAGGLWRPAGRFWCSVLCGRWVL